MAVRDREFNRQPDVTLHMDSIGSRRGSSSGARVRFNMRVEAQRYGSGSHDNIYSQACTDECKSIDDQRVHACIQAS